MITICIVNYNSSEFVLNTLYCLEKLTKNNYKVIIRDNNSNPKDFENLKNNTSKIANVELYTIKNFSHFGSMAHGIAVNDLIKKIDTKYGVFLDADCTFLCKNWDEILISEINEKFPIIGVPGSSTPGASHSTNFPIFIGVLFDADILKRLKIDFRPKTSGTFKDTGYEVEYKFLEKGYKGKVIISKSTRHYKYGPFNKIICMEYYLEGYNGIFMCHFGRGSSLGIAKYFNGWRKTFYSLPIIGAYLLQSKGKREKKRWLKICREIVDKFN